MTLRHTIEGRTCLRQIFAKGEEMRYVTQSTVSAVTLYPTNVIDYGDPCSLPLSLARFPFNCRNLEEGSLEKCLHFLVLYAFSSWPFPDSISFAMLVNPWEIEAGDVLTEVSTETGWTELPQPLFRPTGSSLLSCLLSLSPGQLGSCSQTCQSSMMVRGRCLCANGSGIFLEKTVPGACCIKGS